MDSKLGSQTLRQGINQYRAVQKLRMGLGRGIILSRYQVALPENRQIRNPQAHGKVFCCHIPTKSVTAENFLDEKHVGPVNIALRDNNTYMARLGSIDGHNVVIATLPEGG
ncbi:hypothetical protein QBC42DRAFT_253312 [Cladorrhinum samala]|uniref:Uncharacterized protein n=1 Tax=Cladorrhinum samala TaxID=585594 RepID=A0AAV9HIN8_9PEZI|nr:hypothetical protein QBC42DRAFT_253312 [Cladorrhinum samala]